MVREADRDVDKRRESGIGLKADSGGKKESGRAEGEYCRQCRDEETRKGQGHMEAERRREWVSSERMKPETDRNRG